MMAYIQRGFTEAGMNPAPGSLMADWLRKAGAVDVQTTILSFPMGCAAATKEAQTSTTENLMNMIDNWTSIGSSKIPDLR